MFHPMKSLKINILCTKNETLKRFRSVILRSRVDKLQFIGYFFSASIEVI